MSDQNRRRTRTLIISSECECVRLLQESPNREQSRDSDDLQALAWEQELMRGIDWLLRPGTLACK